MKKTIKITAFIMAILIAVIGIVYHVSKPFTVKLKHIENESIPYEAFKTEAFYEDYLKPLMTDIGFHEEEILVDEIKATKERAQFDDGSLLQNHARANYRFKIPNSRYYVAVVTEISWITKGLYKEQCFLLNRSAESCFLMQIYLTDKENTSRIAFKEIFSQVKLFPFDEAQRGTYSGEDPTAVIFEEEHTTQEIYQHLVSFFAEPEVKEALYLEQRAK